MASERTKAMRLRWAKRRFWMRQPADKKQPMDPISAGLLGVAIGLGIATILFVAFVPL